MSPRSKLFGKNDLINKAMFLVLVDPNVKRVDERIWKLDEAAAAMMALVECGCGVHLAVITMRSDVDESFVSTI